MIHRRKLLTAGAAGLLVPAAGLLLPATAKAQFSGGIGGISGSPPSPRLLRLRRRLLRHRLRPRPNCGVILKTYS